MELRSGRLVRRSPPPPPRRVRSRHGPCGGADDPLSALPDDMLLLVLARLRCARNAARTGILSRRWRGLWTHLPDLTFHDVAPAKVEVVLDRLASSPWVSATLDIYIPPTHCGDDARLTSLLDAVAKFSPRELNFSYRRDTYMEVAELNLPCFPRATSIEIAWDSNICFTQLPAGEFSALERLSLRAASDIATLVTRCPRLRVLSVVASTSDIKVHSVSLQSLEVIGNQECISSIDIVTPKLKQLELIFDTDKDTDLSVSISAPMVEEVVWIRIFTNSTRLFGFWDLRNMGLRHADRCRRDDYWLPSVYVLSLDISAIDQLYDELDLEDEVEFAQEMEKLPVIKFSVLRLDIETDGHVFGALVWRLLRSHQSFAAMKRLLIYCIGEKKTCSENCAFDEPRNWRCQRISLTHLEAVLIDGFTGEDHELDFLKLIFRSSPVLNRVTLKLVPEFGGCTKKIYNTFLAYPHVKGYVYLRSGEPVPPPSD